MRAKDPFALDEHIAIGGTLAEIAEIATHLLCGLARRYRRESRVMRAIANVDRALLELRNALHEDMCAEHGDHAPAYFGVASSRPAEESASFAARPFRPLPFRSNGAPR